MDNSRNNKYLSIYLAIIGECSCTVLISLMRYIISLDPEWWFKIAIDHGDIETMVYAANLGGYLELGWKWCMIRAAATSRINIMEYASTQLMLEYPKTTLCDVWNECIAVASYEGHMEAILYIKSRNLELTDWNACMMGGSSGGKMHIVQYAEKQGADAWNECLSEASFSGQMHIVKYMIIKGANAWDWCIINAAYCEKQNSDIIDLLKHHKALGK